MEKIEFCKLKLAILDKRIRAFPEGYRQNIAILGDDEKEISYLLENYFESNLPQEMIYVHTTTSHVDRKSFFKGVATSLLSEYTNKEDSLDNLINITSPQLSAATDFIKNVLKRNSSPTFLEVLEVINKFINESGRKCIFIVENFLGLKKMFPNFHNDFSKFIILQRSCMVILTSVNTRESEKTLHSDLNFLFGNFEKIFINERHFIENYIAIKNLLFPLPYSPFFISFLVNIIGHSTFYCNLMKTAIKENYTHDNEDAAIISIIKSTLYSRETYFFQNFIERINSIEHNFKNPHPIIRLLLYISEGYIREKELLSLHIFELKELRIKLQKLSELNYIENLGNVYKVKDPLFSFWLSHVFKLFFSPPITDSRKRKIIFEKNLQETITCFKEDFFKDKVKKVLELIASFKNDILRVGNDRYRLPLVEKSRLISYPEKKLHLLIGEGKEIIFVGIKEESVDDNDIFDFIEKGGNVKGKGVKKIFISLDTFTSTARLAAKNNKLITWDINEINDLLQIYNKPIISFENKINNNRITSENFSNF